MIKSNLIKCDNKSYTVDFGIDGKRDEIIVDYLLIMYQLLTNKILDEDTIDILNETVKLAIKETGNDFKTFAKGVLEVYIKK